MANNFSSDAIELIKEFEGLELTSYPDPGTGGDPWTIGFGHTSGVLPGDRCTLADAEAWLIDDLKWVTNAINSKTSVELPQSVFDALTSFVYNVGAGAYGDSTLLRRLNAGEEPVPVLVQELPKWVKGGSGVLPGLVRRRDAEVDLAKKGQPKKAEPVASDSSISLVNAATYYKGESQQIEAFEYLEDLLTLEELDEFARLYRNGAASSDRVLKVPYFYQLDNGPSGDRQCFSSTCAMLLEYLRPGTLSGSNGDVQYLDVLEQYGDTTDPQAQIKTLAAFGVDAEFVTNASLTTLEKQIAKGVPVPCGWLHYGTSSAPSGGGHWSLVIGMRGDKTVHNDPFGKADQVGGGYVRTWPTDGKGIEYSKKHWLPRWEVEGTGTGWAVIAK
jgi:GH24 family phage-related lysozyme (muramidase)